MLLKLNKKLGRDGLVSESMDGDGQAFVVYKFIITLSDPYADWDDIDLTLGVMVNASVDEEFGLGTSIESIKYFKIIENEFSEEELIDGLLDHEHIEEIDAFIEATLNT